MDRCRGPPASRPRAPSVARDSPALSRIAAFLYPAVMTVADRAKKRAAPLCGDRESIRHLRNLGGATRVRTAAAAFLLASWADEGNLITCILLALIFPTLGGCSQGPASPRGSASFALHFAAPDPAFVGTSGPQRARPLWRLASSIASSAHALRSGSTGLRSRRACPFRYADVSTSFPSPRADPGAGLTCHGKSIAPRRQRRDLCFALLVPSCWARAQSIVFGRSWRPLHLTLQHRQP